MISKKPPAHVHLRLCVLWIRVFGYISKASSYTVSSILSCKHQRGLVLFERIWPFAILKSLKVDATVTLMAARVGQATGMMGPVISMQRLQGVVSGKCEDTVNTWSA